MEEQAEYNAGKKEESDERIIVRIAKYKTCEQCGGNCKDRNWCIKPGMARNEAIEKIEAELLLCDLSTMDNKEIAEAALNALLGEK